MWNNSTQRKIYGKRAPTAKTLERYLRKHPQCEVYTGQSRTASAKFMSPGKKMPKKVGRPKREVEEEDNSEDEDEEGEEEGEAMQGGEESRSSDVYAVEVNRVGVCKTGWGFARQGLCSSAAIRCRAGWARACNCAPIPTCPLCRVQSTPCHG